VASREIAQALVVEESTIKAHVHHVLTKLGAKSRWQAILMTQAENFDNQP
jgi:DNA-binding NarL/FixJ family response regulator